MLQKYITYIKDNPQGYWFKRRLYGWGWFPVTREGWFVIGVYILFIVNFARDVQEEKLYENEGLITILAPIILATLILVYICYLKGEPPKWQWGFPKKK